MIHSTLYCRKQLLLILLVGLIFLIPSQLISQKNSNKSLPIGTIVYEFPAPLNDPTLPFSIVIIDAETPDWAHLMYQPNPNFTKVTESYENWRKYNPDIKGDHVRNYRKLKGFLFLNDALDENGFIDIPTNQEIKAINKKIKQDRKAFAERLKNKKSNSPTWQFHGPDHMKETNWTGSNRHINVYSITQSLSNTDILYATTESGATVYKTTDNGDSWSSVSEELITSMGSRNIEVAPSDPDIVYLCTKHDIYKTTIGGNTWNTIYNENNSDNRTLIIHPSNPDTVLAGGNNGIIKSVDGGSTWTTTLPDRNIYDLRYKPGSTEIIYALADSAEVHYTEFYKSIDGGDTWSKMTTGWPNESSTKNIGGQMTTSDGHPHIIYAFIGATWMNQNNNHNIKILKSSDSGETWTTKVDYDNARGINSGQGYYDWDIEMSDIDSNIVAFGTQNSWISYDGLETAPADMRRGWSGHADIQEMLFNGTEIWVTNDGGIIKYDNDSLYNWTAKSTGLNSISYWGYDHGWNKDVGCGVHYHNGTSTTSESYETNLGVSLGGAEPHFALVSIKGDKVVSKGYGSVNGYNIADEQGGNFSRFQYNLTPNKDRYFGNNGAIHPAYYNTHYQPFDNTIARTTDFGTTWDTLYTFPNADDYSWDIRMTRANLDMMLVSTMRSSSIGGADVYKSLDSGATFTKLSLPSWFDNGPNIINIAISNEDANTFYLMRSRNGTKIAKTTDGGTTWTDLSSSALDGYGGFKLMINEGTDGGLYLIAGRGVFYRNNTLSDWQLISDGLPTNASTEYIHPFYRDNEVRLVTNRGVYASTLYDTPELSNSLLQPTVNQKTTLCSRDTFYFDDYSIVNHTGAEWSWSFPGATYVSSTSVRNPKVIYASSGTYDITMNITKGGNTYTKTISQMVNIDDKCGIIDTIPGMALNMPGGSDYAITDDFDITTNEFSYTAWIKPTGGLRAFSGMFSNGIWCAHCNEQTLGLEINYWGGHLWYRWPGSTSGWASRTSLAPQSDQWSYVAMVMSPDSVTVYLNDEKWVSHITHEPADIGQLYLGKGFYSKYFKGMMDEVTFWKKSLTEKEVRELMHLTKDPSNHPDLLAYYQFNEPEGNALDKAQTYKAYLQENANRVPSSAPTGGGVSFTANEANGKVVFGNTGVEINYAEENGAEVTISKIRNNPYFSPENMDTIYKEQYWALHRYGTGAFKGDITFTVEEDISEKDMFRTDDYVLLGRAAHADSTWVVIDTASVLDPINDKITFSEISNDYQQFLIAQYVLECNSVIQYSNRTDLPGTSQSSAHIEAGNINNTGDVRILSGQIKAFRAKQYISLLSGFEVEQGAVFEASIEECPE